MLDLILALHFLGLFMGGAPGLGMLVIGAVIAGAPVEHRSSIGRAVVPLRMIGYSGIALLVVTGVILAVANGVFANGPVWFWIKLLAVVVLIFGIYIGGKAGARAMAGDQAAAGQARTIGKLNVLVIVIIVLSATLAFH